MNDQIEGIVVSVKDYREHDSLLHVLTSEDQMMSIIARGVQKVKSKNAPACQLFTYTRMQLNYREQATMQSLRSAEILESYRKIREDLLKQSIASYFCECIDKSGFELDAFDLLKTSLEILKVTTHPFRILCLFQSLINRMHGIEPYVDGCVRCGTAQGIYGISRNDGGFVCKLCYKRVSDHAKSIEELKRFRLISKAELKHDAILASHAEFTYEDFEELYGFFAEYSGVSLRSIRFLRCLMDMEEKS